MKKMFSLAIAVAFAFSSIAVADVADNTGTGIDPIPDNDPAGFVSTISIGASETITDVEFTLFGLNHTWVGDIFATIEHNGTTVDLMSRVGGGGNGDSSNFGGDYNFSDDGADLWAAAAAAAGTDDIVAGGDYFATDGTGAMVSLATAFAGADTAGDWTLTISDQAGLDTGGFTGWGVSAVSSAAIPEPTGLVAVALVGLAGLVRRRK